MVTTTEELEGPSELEAPAGVFESRDEAVHHIQQNAVRWQERAGSWPFIGKVRINQYAGDACVCTELW